MTRTAMGIMLSGAAAALLLAGGFALSDGAFATVAAKSAPASAATSAKEQAAGCAGQGSAGFAHLLRTRHGGLLAGSSQKSFVHAYQLVIRALHGGQHGAIVAQLDRVPILAPLPIRQVCMKAQCLRILAQGQATIAQI